MPYKSGILPHVSTGSITKRIEIIEDISINSTAKRIEIVEQHIYISRLDFIIDRFPYIQ